MSEKLKMTDLAKICGMLNKERDHHREQAAFYYTAFKKSAPTLFGVGGVPAASSGVMADFYQEQFEFHNTQALTIEEKTNKFLIMADANLLT